MIDFESDIFSEIYDQVQVQFPNLYLTGEIVQSPPEFPCVSLVEQDSATFRNSLTTSGAENHAAVMYELNVYSNKKTGKKTECKKIAAVIDALLMNMNFTRMMLQPVPNAADATVYRMMGRYRAVVSKDGVIYRR